jgi:uncharacterized protein
VIAVDTNLLLYAHRRDSPFHEAAVEQIRVLAESRLAWGIPWPCIHEFYSVATNPRAYRPPSTIDEAMLQIEAWLAAPRLVLLHETPDHWDVLRGLLTSGRVMGGMVHDARIAALCLQHGVRELWSADRDFNRFPGLTVRNPLVG